MEDCVPQVQCGLLELCVPGEVVQLSWSGCSKQEGGYAGEWLVLGVFLPLLALPYSPGLSTQVIVG